MARVHPPPPDRLALLRMRQPPSRRARCGIHAASGRWERRRAARTTAPLSDCDNAFRKIANHARLLFIALRPLRLADGPGRGSWDEDRRKKFGAKRKGPCGPCKPLISHKTAKGIFGNNWRKRPEIWKCLAHGDTNCAFGLRYGMQDSGKACGQPPRPLTLPLPVNGRGIACE